MKKFFISVALAAAVLNGVLASVGDRRISASELKVDDVEMLAEGGDAMGPVPWILVGIAYEIFDEALTHKYWVEDESYRSVCDGARKWICSYSWFRNKPCQEGTPMYLPKEKNPNDAY